MGGHMDRRINLIAHRKKFKAQEKMELHYTVCLKFFCSSDNKKTTALSFTLQLVCAANSTELRL